MTEFLSIVSLVTVVSAFVYVRQIAIFVKGLSRLTPGEDTVLHTMSVIVAARNEEDHIGNCVRSLLRQDYPHEKYTITVVDDHSSDGTAAIVEQIAGEAPSVHLLQLTNPAPGVSPKIRALNEAISVTHSELIVTTDADCIVKPGWLSGLNRYFHEDVGAVSGITLFTNLNQISTMLFGFQYLDFYSQTACGAGAIGMNGVNNCNGSNMAFRRKAFEDVGGYSSIDRVNSGSDSLLAQKIAATRQWRIRFAYTPDTHVTTTPLPTWRGLLEQRMRWAGQTPRYRTSTLFFLVASFVFYLLLFVFVPYSLLNFELMPVPAVALLCKCLTDYWIISRFQKMTNVGGIMKYFWFSELLHPPVVLGAVLGSFFGSFDWKGRKMERTISDHPYPQSPR